MSIFAPKRASSLLKLSDVVCAHAGTNGVETCAAFDVAPPPGLPQQRRYAATCLLQPAPAERSSSCVVRDAETKLHAASYEDCRREGDGRVVACSRRYASAPFYNFMEGVDGSYSCSTGQPQPVQHPDWGLRCGWIDPAVPSYARIDLFPTHPNDYARSLGVELGSPRGFSSFEACAVIGDRLLPSMLARPGAECWAPPDAVLAPSAVADRCLPHPPGVPCHRSFPYQCASGACDGWPGFLDGVCR